MGARMMIKRVAFFGVLWLVSFAATVGVLTALAGSGKADELPPPPPGVRADGTTDVSQMSDVEPVAGPEGETIGWAYSSITPDRPPSEAPSDHVNRITENVVEIVNSQEIPDSPGVVTHPGPIFSTREEAESYRDALLASGSGGAPVNVND